MLENLKNYGPYVEFVETKQMKVNVADINIYNWHDHFYGILNILKDGIETDFVQKTFIAVDFGGPEKTIELSIVDYYFNLIMWYLVVRAGDIIEPKHIYFDKAITRKNIKRYIDKFFIKKNRKRFSNLELNNIIDDMMSQFMHIDNFALYLANTVNLEDTIALMKACPEFNALLHADLSNIPIEDVKNVGMDMTNRAIDYIINAKKYIGYDHCMATSLLAEEGINKKQLKELIINIGSKPNGQGGVYPAIINKSFITGGVNDLLSYFIESSTGRVAQILSKNNVGASGHFARLLGLNNSDTYLHQDPNYVCDSVNFQIVFIKDEKFLNKFIDRYYRLQPNGVERLLTEEDTHLIGQNIYLRSPMTCASHSRGNGICYRCYGDLAYTNNDINAGKMSSEEISSKLTQILLSAKHLLETVIKKLLWPEKFFDYFEVDGNVLKLLSDIQLKGSYMVIDPEAIYLENEDISNRGDNDDEESGESYSSAEIYNEYLTEFHIIPNGNQAMQIKIGTEDKEKLYLSSYMSEIVRKYEKNNEDKLYIPLQELEGIPMFFIPINNNELSKTMEKLIDIINKVVNVKDINRHQFLQEFISTVIEGNLDVTATHCEVILMNQLRNVDDILEVPQWQYPNEPCNILTLNQALTDHPSVVVSLSYQRLGKTLYNPLTFRKTKPSNMDLFFMPTPQNYLNNRDNIIKSGIQSDVEVELKKAVIHHKREKQDDEECTTNEV